MTKSNNDICPVCGRFTIDCGQVSCFEKERLMRTNAKSNEAKPREFWIEVKSFSSEILAAYYAKPAETTYRIAKDVIHTVEYQAYEVLEAKCAKYEAALKWYAEYAYFNQETVAKKALE